MCVCAGHVSHGTTRDSPTVLRAAGGPVPAARTMLRRGKAPRMKGLPLPVTFDLI